MEWCDSSIPNVDKLSPVGSSDSIEYHASCSAGFELSNNNTLFKCENRKWSPTLECLKEENVLPFEGDVHITGANNI